MTDPVVSVVMPTYNAEAFVDAAVSSIRAQTVTDFELIAIDDGSQDRTVEILTQHAVVDPRIKVLRRTHRGISDTLNEGIAASRGAFIARMDADDVAVPQRLERQLAALMDRPKVAVAGSNYEIIDHSGRHMGASDLPTDPAEIRRTLDRNNCIAHPTVVMRRDAVLAVGGYRRAFAQCEDYDLWLRLCERHDLINVADPLLRYRQHPGQLEWLEVEQRAYSVMGAQLAAQRRRSGLPELTDGVQRVARSYLQAAGMDDRSINEGIIRRAIDAATVALRAGYRAEARRALAVAVSQPGLQGKTRLRCCYMRMRSFLP